MASTTIRYRMRDENPAAPYAETRWDRHATIPEIINDLRTAGFKPGSHAEIASHGRVIVRCGRREAEIVSEG